MANQIVSAERFRAVLQCDSENGVLTWLVYRGPRAKAGMVAGTLNHMGYITVIIDGKLYLAHRLIWFFATGNWPKGQIDHVNGRRADNRLANLREATHSQNQQNQRQAQRNNLSSGFLGASRITNNNKWQAQIQIERKTRYLGSFDTPELAHAAYVAAKRLIHPFGTL